jgi:hypothetical protein
MAQPGIRVELLLAISAPASAQRVDPRPVTWSLAAPAMRAVPASGVLGFAALQARIAPGWHLYSMTQPPGGPGATRIAVAAGSAFRLAGSVRRPARTRFPTPSSAS